MAIACGLMAVVLLGLSSGATAHLCKAVPGSPEWPSPAAWQQLNATVGGRLIDPSPPAAVCHPERPEYDSEACKAVTKGWSTHDFHMKDPVSAFWSQWTNDTCLPDPEFPCVDNGYPTFVVNATTAEHVKHTVNFARENNVRLVVKNTGHDYLGRSTAPNSLSIWTHYMSTMVFDDDAFTPQGCSSASHEEDEPRITTGPGSQFINIYSYLDQFRYTIVGGSGPTVGIGGYVTGGGHGILSAKRGLAADQVLEMEMVTPQGDIVILNECQNTDLFWAVRGGGGSTFGVVTSVTMKAYPTPNIVAGRFSLTAAPNTTAAIGIGSLVLSRIPDIVEQGGGGYMWSMAEGSVGGNTTVGGIYGVLAVEGSEDITVLEKIWSPIVAEARRRWGSAVQFGSQPEVYPSLLAYMVKYHDTSEAGIDKFIDTRLLSSEALRGEPEELYEANKCAAARYRETMQVLIVSGKGPDGAQPRGAGTAVNPAWRKADAVLAMTQWYQPQSQPARLQAIDTVNECMEHLRKLEPDSGAYVNEALRSQPDWQHVFWGDNYERLVEVKKTVDPGTVLWCDACVGSEQWEEIDGQLCQI